MEWLIYIAYLVVGLAVASIPGPGILYVVSESIERGSKRAWPAVFGALSVSIFFGTISILGMALVLRSYSELWWFIRVFGAILLIYIGFKRLTANKKLEYNQQSSVIPISKKKNSYITSFLVSLSNPKTMLYYLFVIPQFIHGPNITKQYIFLVGNQVGLKACALVIYCVLAGKIATIISLEKNSTKINMMFGGVFILAGIVSLLL